MHAPVENNWVTFMFGSLAPAPAILDTRACRRGVKRQLRSLPAWARNAEPGVALLSSVEITAAALKAKCRACGGCKMAR